MDALLLAVLDHLYLWPAVDKGILNLIGYDLVSAIHDLLEVLGIEVGQPQVLDLPSIRRFSK